jgi:uncharacterized protein YgbK (DUF1537 family)
VLDDDPTGTQTVHRVWVVTRWTEEALGFGLRDEAPLFYVLTNSRSLPEEAAVALNRRIAANLARAAETEQCNFDVISRSDSTLRGHFPAEVDALRDELETRLNRRYDGVIVCPFFPEGGRLTAGDVHYVAERDVLTPAGGTEYAKDPDFGYTKSDLRHWVEEKTEGRVAASDVVSVDLDTIRRHGPSGVQRILATVTGGRVAVVNALTYDDLSVFVAGLLAAQDDGQRFLFRTAASFVKALGGVPDRDLLTREEMVGQPSGRGLVAVGSHVEKTTRQLERALGLEDVRAVELNVRRVLTYSTRDREIERVAAKASRTLKSGSVGVVFTSRGLVTDVPGVDTLEIGRRVSAALVEIVRRVSVRPDFVIAKGGITSSDVATEGLQVKRARVLGQILAGVPVWQLGPESRFPDLPYVVFPGNVGTDDALREAIEILTGPSQR